jgi:hypothetical protein
MPQKGVRVQTRVFLSIQTNLTIRKRGSVDIRPEQAVNVFYDMAIQHA